MQSDFDRLPITCAGCMFWESHNKLERRCGAECDAHEHAKWFHCVLQEWGDCGRVAHDDEEMLGFIKYAPSGYFPQAQTFPSAPLDPNVPLIACMHISEDVAHHGLGTLLLRAALKDLSARGERKVEAFGAVHLPEDVMQSPALSVEFLQRNGFTIVRPDGQFPLLQLELKSLVSWTENLEAVLDSLKLPLRIPERAPVPW